MQNYPELIEQTLIEIETWRQEIQDLRRVTAEIKETKRITILNAKNEAGKALYSNDQARDAQLVAELAKDEMYQGAVSQLDKKEYQKAVSEARLERLRGEFKLYLLDRQQEVMTLPSATRAVT
ncbi:MAG TPA: hypothetical protein VFQ92_23600 [Blastocatellia bacterium]|nr:hypothetical protein [Blastocatellia bacterium]